MCERRNPVCRALWILAALVLIAGPTAAQEPPPAWEIDYDASEIVASARQMGSPVPARFDSFEGEIRFDRDRIDDSMIAFEIDVASIRAANEDVETEAKSEDWFHADQYPTARFQSTSIRSVGDGRYEVSGDISIKGVTREITVPFELSVEEAPSSDALTGSAKGEFTIQRLDFGVGKGEWGDTAVVSNEVTIRVSITGRRPK